MQIRKISRENVQYYNSRAGIKPPETSNYEQ